MKISQQNRLIRHAALGTMVFSAFAAYQGQAKTYIVHLRSPSTFQKAADSLVEALRTQTLASKDLLGNRRLDLPTLLGSSAKTLNALKHLNMVVIEASDEDFQGLSQDPEVNFIEADTSIPVPRPPMGPSDSSVLDVAVGSSGTNGEKPWGIDAVKANGAWDLGYKGQGVRVLVLDTGIDKDHPDIKNRFEEGRNFVTTRPPLPGLRLGSTIFADPSELLTQDDANVNVPYDYFDQNGHGTHCSGTILGEQDDKGVVGVAPQAKLLMGRVCGKFGCAGTSIVSGLNWAVSKGVDVVSMSLGGPNNSRSQQEAIDAVDHAGIVVVAASGNDSAEKVSFPAASPSVIAVGAVDSSLKRASFSNYGPELAIVGPGVDVQSSVPMGSGRAANVQILVNNVQTEIPSTSFLGAPAISQPLNAVLVPAGLGKPADFTGLQLSGKIALIQRGEITFAEKVKNAIAAGAAGAVIYNNTDGLMSGALTEDGTEIAIPVVMIEKVQGDRLAAAIQHGQAQSLSLNIYKTNYASFSGTSMATPHLAGVVALIRGANHSLNTKQVRHVLTSTAQHLGDANPQHNEYGAGLVNAEAAVRAAIHSHNPASSRH